MANRFLETNYYKSPFVRGLKGALKGLYSFIICDCTPSGIWAMDMEAASMYIGFIVTEKEFEECFIKKGKAIEISNGKYFFPDFIEHQYPKGLQSTNKAHNNIIKELKKFNLIDENYQVLKGALKGLQSPQGTGNGIGNGIGNGKLEQDPPEPEQSKYWFLKFYKSPYADYKKVFNGKSCEEHYFLEWKKFIDKIYEKKFDEIFECKFLSPHDFAKLVLEEDFKPDDWEPVLKAILATGVKPEHNLFFRIPQFLKYENRTGKSTASKKSINQSAARNEARRSY